MTMLGISDVLAMFPAESRPSERAMTPLQARAILANNACLAKANRLIGKEPDPISQEQLDRLLLASEIDTQYQSSNAPGYVYLLRDRGRIKIGFSKRPKARLNTLSLQRQFKMVACEPGTYQDESKLHRRFKQYRISGEWFELTGQMKEFARAPTRNLRAAIAG